ncbi:MAG: hypothetical protein IPM71_04150 [Bacteroidota bacterium]|nr:MAG: hypothetical protein IPM71_04150 [Bacteroidota bacterium]
MKQILEFFHGHTVYIAIPESKRAVGFFQDAEMLVNSIIEMFAQARLFLVLIIDNF